MRKLFFKKSAIMAIFALFALFSSCTKEIFTDELSLDDGEVEAILTLTTPSTFTRSTKGLTVDQESIIDNIYVYALKEGVVSRCAQGEEINNKLDQDGKKSFKVSLSASASENDKYKIIVFANIGDVLSDVPSCLGMSESQMQAKLQSDIKGKLFVGDNVLESIVMHGVADGELITINSNSKLNVKLTRNIARIDIGVGVRDIDNASTTGVWTNPHNIPFVINSAYVFRPSKKQYFMPVDESVISGVDKFTAKVSATTFNYTVGENAYFLQEIYAPEADIMMGETEPGGSNHTERMAMVVGGFYQSSTTETFYRIDFAKKSESNHLKQNLMNVERNHLYSISISGVSDSGYPTPEEAYSGTSMNMSVEILNWDLENMNDIIFDGQYYFSITSKKVQLSPMGNDEVVLDIETNVKDWGMTWNAATNGSVSGDKLTFNDDNFTIVRTNKNDKEYQLKITSKGHNIGTGGDKTASLDITAGRLKTLLSIEQKATQSFVSIPGDMILMPEGMGNKDDLAPKFIEVLALGTVTVAVETANSDWLTLESVNTDAIAGFTHLKYKIIAKRYRYGDGNELRSAKITVKGTNNNIEDKEVIISQNAPYVSMSKAMLFPLNTAATYEYKINTNIIDARLIPVTTDPSITLGEYALFGRNLQYSVGVLSATAAKTATYKLSVVEAEYDFPEQLVKFYITNNGTNLGWSWTLLGANDVRSFPWHMKNLGVTVTSGAGWQWTGANTSPGLSFSPNSSISPTQACTIDLAENYGAEDRKDLTIQLNNLSPLPEAQNATIKFTQEAQKFFIKPELFLQNDTIKIPYDGDGHNNSNVYKQLTVNSSVNWTVQFESAGWLTTKTNPLTVDDVTKTKIISTKLDLTSTTTLNMTIAANISVEAFNSENRISKINFTNNSAATLPYIKPKNITIEQYAPTLKYLSANFETASKTFPGASRLDDSLRFMTNLSHFTIKYNGATQEVITGVTSAEPVEVVVPIYIPPYASVDGTNSNVPRIISISVAPTKVHTVPQFKELPIAGLQNFSQGCIFYSPWSAGNGAPGVAADEINSRTYNTPPEVITYYERGTIVYRYGSIIPIHPGFSRNITAYIAAIPSYVTNIMQGNGNLVMADPGTPIDDKFHTADNIKRGLGDVCRLIGLTADDIKSGKIDNGIWRMPTSAEYGAILSGKIHTSGYVASSGPTQYDRPAHYGNRNPGEYFPSMVVNYNGTSITYANDYAYSFSSDGYSIKPLEPLQHIGNSTKNRVEHYKYSNAPEHHFENATPLRCIKRNAGEAK